MFQTLLKSITTFFAYKPTDPVEFPRRVERSETVQDAFEKLLDSYSPFDLKRCDEISDLYNTLNDAQSFNPQTPVRTLPSSKIQLIRKYL